MARFVTESLKKICFGNELRYLSQKIVETIQSDLMEITWECHGNIANSGYVVQNNLPWGMDIFQCLNLLGADFIKYELCAHGISPTNRRFLVI